ncbi:MAG TPA: sigma-70 family RNA polymerase sigma factor [Armatimonadota bacterium]|nr:sigma-70 family RNA polymerase sigma factor [Armatimonadota bacterium]
MTRRTSAELQSTLTQLWREFKQRNSISARNSIIDHYHYLITKTRQRIIPSVPVRIQADDLDQEGQIALVKAVDHFDLNRKVKFESYAISMVRGAMLEYLRREDWVPRSVRTKQKLVNRAEEELALRHGPENVKDTDLAEYLEMPIDAFYQLYYEANVLQVVSLEDVVGDSEHEDLDPLVVLESVKSKEPDPHTLAIVDSQRNLMAQCISWLPLQERTVITHYYYDGMTLKQIAKQIGRSESRAHQLHSQAVQRLSGFIARQHGLFFPEALPVPQPAPAGREELVAR